MRLEPHPKPWTHHHTHRLYHMSVGLCFAFAALAMIGTMATVWLQAEANPVSHNVTISANVAGVSPGPVDPGGSSGSHINPQQTSNPTISIVAEPQGTIPVVNSAYVFSQQRPTFSGVTSVPNGLVFVTIRGAGELNSTTQATGAGQWSWQSPINLGEGSYTIRVAVFDSFDLTRSGSAQVAFVVDVPADQIPLPSGVPPTSQPPGSGGLPKPQTPAIPSEPSFPPILTPEPDLMFGLFFKILDKYKYVTAGENVSGAVSLVSNLQRQISNVEVKYVVTAPDGSPIVVTTDTLSFSKHSQFLKTFLTAPLTKPGDYTVTLTATYEGVPSVASDTFRIIAPVSGGGTITDKQKPVIIWSLLGLLWLLFIVLVIIAYRRIRHHTREIRGAALGSGPLGNQQ